MTDDIYHDSFLGGLTLTDPFIIIIPLMLPSHRLAQARSLQIQNFTAFNRGGRAVASNYELGFFFFETASADAAHAHSLSTEYSCSGSSADRSTRKWNSHRKLNLQEEKDRTTPLVYRAGNRTICSPIIDWGWQKLLHYFPEPDPRWTWYFVLLERRALWIMKRANNRLWPV